MSEVLVDYDDGLIVITINRPEARNAINRAVSLGVCAALDELDSRDDLRVGILTGAGGSFCAGMDLKAFLAGFPYTFSCQEENHHFPNQLYFQFYEVSEVFDLTNLHCPFLFKMQVLTFIC